MWKIVVASFVLTVAAIFVYMCDDCPLSGLFSAEAASPRSVLDFTMRDIDESGMASVARAALQALDKVDVLHVSLDMDALDPSLAPGVGTPVRGGLSYREAHLLMEILSDDGRAQALDIVEVNPILDARNATAQLAVELAASLLGSRIL